MKFKKVKLVFLLGCAVISAQARDVHVLDVIYPQVGQQGSRVEVMAEGSFLQRPEEVLFYQDGIQCLSFEPVTEATDFRHGGPRKLKEEGLAVRMVFEIAKEAPLGEHQLRIRTHDNLSEMVTFWVTPFPVVAEEHAWADEGETRNDTPETAQIVRPNSTVSGYLPSGPPQDHDWYKIELEKGRRLSVETVAARLGTWHYGGMNDAALRIYDEELNELARNDDNALHAQDPMVSLVAPRDGTYFIHMHQQMDYETTMRHYVMHVGTFPLPGTPFPLGGPAGGLVKVRWKGAPGEGVQRLIALSGVPSRFEEAFHPIYLREPMGGSSPSAYRIHVAPFENVMEEGRHAKPEFAQVVDKALPMAINGVIETEGETDWYRFEAQAGTRYRVRTYAATLGSELDAKIWIRAAEGNPDERRYEEDDSTWPPHDWVGHHLRWQVRDRLDPIFMFEPEETGAYLLGIADTRREYSDQHVYRVEFQPHRDSAFVHFAAFPSHPIIVRDRIVVAPGNAVSRPMNIQNGFGSRYEGALRLRAEGLPAGVTMEFPAFTAKDTVIPVLFKANSFAEVGARLIDLIVEPVEPEARATFQGGFVQVNPATNRRGDFAMYFNRTRKMALAVVAASPFKLAIEQPEVALVQNGELGLKVNVVRNEGFEGAVYCQLDWLPKGVNKQPPMIIEPDQTQGVYRISARQDAEPGVYGITIAGRENAGGHVRSGAGFHYAGSPFVRLEVSEPYMTVKLERSAIERGKTGRIVGRLKHHKPIDGKATARLGRLPYGVRQVKPFPEIKADDETVSFRIEVTQDCLVGSYKDIFCEVTISDGDQEIRQQTGNGILRVDPERK